MKKSFNKWTLAAVTAAAMGLPLGNAAFAEEPAAPQPLQLAANETVNDAEEAVTDTWITSKVKASFLADDSISGLDIKVETNQGVVSLSGVVPTDAERDLAVEKAKTIKGVKAVSADGLKSTE
ncbi:MULTISPECIES: BON domain-containing protein [Pseudomonas]|jgi:hyperosmotically inducible protein|uniref:BON domain-containing protein n=1 Tax=Pseudomonas TaxID=286 RepID=UPI001C82244E|nr:MULTISPECIES: BON domain-containing protein [Pseudomonas]MDG9928435.1 BON domain-containing protein [Pseudomonas sp. GD04042]MDH0482605.1 BON domain-containing protein [Pseudomonas sp. GD04015]MDH0604693.1 BON domain-containing protein [Pseudomonas sp. GD03869]